MYYVYILQCSDNSYYIGYTTDLKNRIKEHNEGSGGRNTRLKSPVELLYTEKFENKSDALKREAQIKRWTRAKKEALIKGENNLLHELSKRGKP